MPEIGVITEQGDLGLFNPLDENDQKAYNEATERQSQSEKDKKEEK